MALQWEGRWHCDDTKSPKTIGDFVRSIRNLGNGSEYSIPFIPDDFFSYRVVVDVTSLSVDVTFDKDSWIRVQKNTHSLFVWQRRWPTIRHSYGGYCAKTVSNWKTLVRLISLRSVFWLLCLQTNLLLHICVNLDGEYRKIALLCLRPNKAKALSDAFVWRLSVAYIGPNSRTERLRKTKLGTDVAHVIRDSNTTFKVKRTEQVPPGE